MPITKDTGVTVEAGDVINDILPFCHQGVDGRDMLAQADYAADLQRTIGHQPGIARQELANKQARQVSHMSAGLAQFLARRYPSGVRDDGDLDSLEEAIVTAVMVLVESRLPAVATTVKNGVSRPDGVTITIDATGKLTASGAQYITAGDCDLLSAGAYICDNSAGTIAHAPPGMTVFFYEKRSIKASADTYLVYDQAESFGGVYRKFHRNYVPSNGVWSAWSDTPYLPAYTKVYRATDAVDARLALQAAVGFNNVSLWASGGKLIISRNDGDTTVETASMTLDPAAGTINGILPAPRPVAEKYVGITNTLPAGGTWAYHVVAFADRLGAISGNVAGVAAGGTTVITGHGYYAGVAWRVA